MLIKDEGKILVVDLLLLMISIFLKTIQEKHEQKKS